MNKILMTGLLFFVSKFMQGFSPYQGAAVDLTKLRLASAYLQVVKVSRVLCMSIVGSLACLIFILLGLMLIHYTILVYAPWEDSIKVAVTLTCAFSYIFIAVGIFIFVFAEDKWMKMFNTEAMIKELTAKHDES